MAKIDFVPDDYVQHRESNRTNFLSLVLFAALMGGIVVTFSIIKMQQKKVATELENVTSKLSSAGEQLAKLEELKVKTKSMMKTMAVTAELLEPVPRSVILACVTNNLPGGVSLLDFKLSQKEITTNTSNSKSSGQYASASASNSTNTEEQAGPKYETSIALEGIAPSDLEVAGFIAQLSSSILFEDVELVESKEIKIDDMLFRAFKLKAMLKQDTLITKEDISKIKTKREGIM